MLKYIYPVEPRFNGQGQWTHIAQKSSQATDQTNASSIKWGLYNANTNQFLEMQGEELQYALQQALLPLMS